MLQLHKQGAVFSSVLNHLTIHEPRGRDGGFTSDPDEDRTARLVHAIVDLITLKYDCVSQSKPETSKRYKPVAIFWYWLYRNGPVFDRTTSSVRPMRVDAEPQVEEEASYHHRQSDGQRKRTLLHPGYRR